MSRSNPEPDEVLRAPSTDEFHKRIKQVSTRGSAMADYEGAVG